MEETDKLVKNAIEISFVGLTMAVGIMWKDIITNILGSNIKNSLIAVLALTILLSFILSRVPENLMPKK